MPRLVAESSLGWVSSRPNDIARTASWVTPSATDPAVRALWGSAARAESEASATWRDGQPADAGIPVAWSAPLIVDAGAIRAPWVISARADRERAVGTAGPELIAASALCSVPWGISDAADASRRISGTGAVAARPVEVGKAAWWGKQAPADTLTWVPWGMGRVIDGGLIIIVEPGDPAYPGSPIIIPVRSTYIVINSASLTRVSNNLSLPVSSISMSIDADSAHWQWSASLPLSALPNLERDSPDQPVELEAVCNGFTARLLVTKLTESERFGAASLQIGGNGIAAEISAPMYASVPHTNVSALNAQQLAEQALMYSGVPLGWSLDWQAPDWLVPAGTWVHMGTPLDAVATIAAAAGAYVQADPAIRTLHILPRYPAAPWEWGGLTPAFVLPSSAVIERGTEHVDRASYNAVEVRGMAGGGIRARVVRTGTAGDLEAQQVVDRLITHQDAARGRGLEILGNTGQQRIVKLETGILPVSGVIPVGSILDWTRGEQAVRGIVRNLSISASVSSGRAPIVVRQTIGVETHA